MPRDQPKPASRRKPPAPLPRQRQHKPVMRPQQMARERILFQLRDLVASCDGLALEHGETCECETCCVVSNVVGALRLFHMILEIS